MALIDRFRETESYATKYFSLSDKPPVLAYGKGARLFDVDGESYIDFGSGSSVMHFGYGNKEVADAIIEQVRTGITHAGPHFHMEKQADLYERLLRLLPPDLNRVHPATNGTEAVETALKFAQHATGKKTFVAFRAGYHGRTLGSLAVSGGKGPNDALAPFLPQCVFLPYPGCDTCPYGTRSACCCRCEDELVDSLYAPKSGAGGLAGIIVEPIQGTGGIRIPPQSFLQKLRTVATDLEVPLIFDEIFTNFGRSGKMFAFEHFDVTPDILVLAKPIGGGLPGGCVVANEGIMGKQKPGSQTSTFQMCPLSAAAGNAALKYISEQDLPGRAQNIDKILKDRYRDLQSPPAVTDVRGIGGMHGIEISDPTTGTPDPKRCKAMRQEILEKGVITYECGTHNHVIGLLPPLVIEKTDIQKAIDIIEVTVNAEKWR